MRKSIDCRGDCLLASSFLCLSVLDALDACVDRMKLGEPARAPPPRRGEAEVELPAPGDDAHARPAAERRGDADSRAPREAEEGGGSYDGRYAGAVGITGGRAAYERGVWSSSGGSTYAASSAGMEGTRSCGRDMGAIGVAAGCGGSLVLMTLTRAGVR